MVGHAADPGDWLLTLGTWRSRSDERRAIRLLRRHRLYESFDFEREGYRKRHYHPGQEYVDAILMAYFIGE